MIVEIISVGNELLSGKIVNTNASYLAKEVTNLGLKCQYITTVGDVDQDVKQAISTALNRANIIMFTGGLGPTMDDMTVESLAKYFSVRMIFVPEEAERIKTIFKTRNLKMPESNLKQAYIPEGADILANPLGTAPGVIWDVSELAGFKKKNLILAFPGVPDEMKQMWLHSAKPIISELSQVKLYEKYVNLTGISESQLIEELSDLMFLEDPQILPYANNFQIQLRVFSSDVSLENAKQKVEAAVDSICAIVGDYVYGYDEDTLESVVAKLLVENKKTISIAESCTGGLVSSRLTDVPGSSDFIKLNFVTYANISKIEMLGVKSDTIDKEGAVSAETASQMAVNVREVSQTDIGVAVTGIAGPSGGSLEKPVGTVFVAIADQSDVLVMQFNTNPLLRRTQVKWRFAQFTLNIIRKYLLNISRQHLQESSLPVVK